MFCSLAQYLVVSANSVGLPTAWANAADPWYDDVWKNPGLAWPARRLRRYPPSASAMYCVVRSVAALTLR